MKKIKEAIAKKFKNRKGSKIQEPSISNPNYGLANKERHRNRGLFRLHGIGNQDRKNMN